MTRSIGKRIGQYVLFLAILSALTMLMLTISSIISNR